MVERFAEQAKAEAHPAMLSFAVSLAKRGLTEYEIRDLLDQHRDKAHRKVKASETKSIAKWASRRRGNSG